MYLGACTVVVFVAIFRGATVFLAPILTVCSGYPAGDAVQITRNILHTRTGIITTHYFGAIAAIVGLHYAIHRDFLIFNYTSVYELAGYAFVIWYVFTLLTILVINAVFEFEQLRKKRQQAAQQGLQPPGVEQVPHQSPHGQYPVNVIIEDPDYE